MSEVVKKYSNGEITVVWDSKKCKHAAECVKNAPNVFRPKEQPWIKISSAAASGGEGGSSDEITGAIDKCPSGALSYLRK